MVSSFGSYDVAHEFRGLFVFYLFQGTAFRVFYSDLFLLNRVSAQTSQFDNTLHDFVNDETLE